MNIQTQLPRAAGSAPTSVNPLRLASATIKAVDQLGVTTADEIEKTAEEIMRGATEIATRLRELADAIRQHTEIASGQVESFCTKATSVFESVVELQQKLRLNGHAPQAEPAEEADGEPLPLPAFIRMGPAEPSEL
jgi:methyl-accepting chemotaxis protein